MSYGGGHGSDNHSVSLNNVAPGTPTGSVVDLGVVFTTPIAVVVAGAGVSAGVVDLEGSLDGVNFYKIASSAALAAPGTFPVVATDATGPIPARYLRCRVSVATVGGNVTAQVAAGA